MALVPIKEEASPQKTKKGSTMLALPAPQYNQDILAINGADKSPINY